MTRTFLGIDQQNRKDNIAALQPSTAGIKLVQPDTLNEWHERAEASVRQMVEQKLSLRKILPSFLPSMIPFHPGPPYSILHPPFRLPLLYYLGCPLLHSLWYSGLFNRRDGPPAVGRPHPANLHHSLCGQQMRQFVVGNPAIVAHNPLPGTLFLSS